MTTSITPCPGHRCSKSKSAVAGPWEREIARQPVELGTVLSSAWQSGTGQFHAGVAPGLRRIVLCGLTMLAGLRGSGIQVCRQAGIEVICT